MAKIWRILGVQILGIVPRYSFRFLSNYHNSPDFDEHIKGWIISEEFAEKRKQIARLSKK